MLLHTLINALIKLLPKAQQDKLHGDVKHGGLVAALVLVLAILVITVYVEVLS